MFREPEFTNLVNSFSILIGHEVFDSKVLFTIFIYVVICTLISFTLDCITSLPLVVDNLIHKYTLKGPKIHVPMHDNPSVTPNHIPQGRTRAWKKFSIVKRFKQLRKDLGEELCLPN
jgi:hypothetical protein